MSPFTETGITRWSPCPLGSGDLICLLSEAGITGWLPSLLRSGDPLSPLSEAGITGWSPCHTGLWGSHMFTV